MCSGCGEPRDESFTDWGEGPDYEAEPHRCRACEVREAEHKKFQDQGGNTHGLYMAVKRIEEV